MDTIELLDFMEEEEKKTSVPRIFRDRTRPYETLTDREFRKYYSFTRPVFFQICAMLYDDLLHPNGRATDLPVDDQVALSIHLLGRNVMQADSARIAGCNQTTVGRTLFNFIEALNRKADDFIFWPKGSENKRMKASFYRNFGIPGVVGIIDGTHIPILGPSSNEEDYVNRKITIVLIYDPVKAGRITIACILRNIAINANEPANYDPTKAGNPLYDEPVPDNGPPPTDTIGAKAYMKRIIDEFF